MYKPNKPGIWEYNDNDGTWFFLGTTWEDYVQAFTDMQEMDLSHDFQLWIVGEKSRHFVQDGCNVHGRLPTEFLTRTTLAERLRS